MGDRYSNNGNKFLWRAPKVGPTFGLHFANSAIPTTRMWDGVHHCIFWGYVCVCVFVLVFVGNVATVKFALF